MSKVARAIAADMAESEASTEAANAVKVYSCEAYWPVLYHVRYDVQATSAEEAMAKLKQAQADDVDMDDPSRCFYELAESCDNSDGSTSLAVWDEEQGEVLLEELSDEERYAQHGEEAIKAIERVLREVPMGAGHIQLLNEVLRNMKGA